MGALEYAQKTDRLNNYFYYSVPTHGSIKPPSNDVETALARSAKPSSLATQGAMMRIDLQVPFSEKDDAKALGARWDPSGKVWFIAQDVNPDLFLRWLPNSREDESQPSASERRVHFAAGKNIHLGRELEKFLRSAGLAPSPWHGVAKLLSPERPTSHLIESVFSNPYPLVIILAGDEQAKPIEDQSFGEYRRASRYESSWALQPLIDIVFLAGLAVGARPEKTILLQAGRLRHDATFLKPYAMKIDNSRRARKALAERLVAAGCPIDESGVWLDTGDFENYQRIG